MKVANIHLEGQFINSKSETFRVEIKSQKSKEVYNFYKSSGIGNGELLACSVFIKYLSRALGARKSGDILKEVFGDYSIYAEFQDLRNSALHYDSKKLTNVSNNKIVDAKLNRFTEVLEKRNDSFYHKLTYYEGNIINEIIQFSHELYDANSVVIDLVAEGKQVQASKVKGKEYNLRDVEEQGQATVRIQSLDFISLKKDITWMKTRNYRILNDKEEFLAYCEKMRNTDSIVGFDTETSGLRINRFPMSDSRRDKLVGICLSTEDNEGVYIPIRQSKFTNLDEDFVIENLEPLLSNKLLPDGNIKKSICNVVTHYGSFDWKVMYTYGWDLNITDDTYILQYLIDVREANAVKKLKVMSEKILGLQMIDLEDFFPSNRGGKKSAIKFSLLPYESVRHYGPTDADITRLLFFKLRPLLPEDMRFIYGIEIDLMKRLGRIEYYGIKLDIVKLIEMRDKVALEKEELEKEIYELAGEVFNINSGDQLERIMFDKLKYPSHGTTSSGKRATGKEVLEILSRDKDKDGNLLYPLADKIFTYKKKEKLLNSFLDKLLRENIDGYIFPKYNQAGTQSGRISCNNPNLQQTSGLIREIFIPDSEEYYFLVVDYSQVEYRIMAGLADEYEVIDFFKSNPEADYHIMMYARMANKAYEKVTSKERKQGKTLNFGISYGMSPPSLALKLSGSNTEEHVKDAENKIKEYFDSVANIRDYLSVIKDGAQLRGFVKTLFNRRRYISEFLKENPKYYEIERGKRKAGNTVVQGTAADIMKFAHTRVERALERRHLDARPVASIHDELVIQVNKKYNPWQMIDIVRNAMELDLSDKNFPPLYIGANVGVSWSDGKKDHLECPVLLMERRREEIKLGMHTEPLDNPKDVLERELKEFAIEIIEEEIKNNNIKTVEAAKEIPRLMKYVGNYLGDKQGDFAIKGILAGEPYKEVLDKLEKVEIYGDTYFDEILDGREDLDEYIDNEEEHVEEEVHIDYKGLQQYYEDNKHRLRIEDTIIKRAREVYNEHYSIVGYDRKLMVSLTNPTESLIDSLRNYFDSVSVEKGYQVFLKIGGNMVELPYKVSKIDRIALTDILASHYNVSA